MRVLIFLIFLFIFKHSEAASASTTSTWKVYDDHHNACILMEAAISLDLSYIVEDNKKETVSFCCILVHISKMRFSFILFNERI